MRIPEDVAVVGVNGEDQGLVITPPLTTAPLHFFEQAYQATLLVFDQLAGETVPPKVVLPTRLLVRQSCGCADPLIIHAQACPTHRAAAFLHREIRLLENLVFGEEEPQLRLPVEEPLRQVFPALLKAFLDENRRKTRSRIR